MPAEKRKRTSNFTLSEKETLLELVQKFRNIIENKKTDAVSQKEKDRAWEKITSSYNSGCTVYRSQDSLKNLWDNIKKTARKSSADHKIKVFKTGGGSLNVEKPDHLSLKVMNLLDATLDGFQNPFDDDYQYNQGFNTGKNVETDISDLELEEENLLTESENDWSNWSKSLLQLPKSAPLRQFINYTQIDSNQLQENTQTPIIHAQTHIQQAHTQQAHTTDTLQSYTSQAQTHSVSPDEHDIADTIPIITPQRTNLNELSTPHSNNSVTRNNMRMTHTPSNTATHNKKLPLQKGKIERLLLENKLKIAMMALKHEENEEERRNRIHSVQLKKEELQLHVLELEIKEKNLTIQAMELDVAIKKETLQNLSQNNV